MHTTAWKALSYCSLEKGRHSDENMNVFLRILSCAEIQMKTSSQDYKPNEKFHLGAIQTKLRQTEYN